MFLHHSSQVEVSLAAVEKRLDAVGINSRSGLSLPIVKERN